MCEKCWTPRPGNISLRDAARITGLTENEVYDKFELRPQGRCVYVRQSDIDEYMDNPENS